jgi:hypothetical protein
MLYDDTTRHYHVMTTVKATMAKRYVCKSCGKGGTCGITYKGEDSCRD